MCTRPNWIVVKPTVNDRLNGFSQSVKIPVPCGKCCECLAQRQNNFMIRTYREAMKYGNMWHLTLTYDEEHLPVAKSLFYTDKDTGLMVQREAAEPYHKSLQVTKVTEVKRYRKNGKHLPLKSKYPELREALPVKSPLRDEILSDIGFSRASRVPRCPSFSLAHDGALAEYTYVESPSYDPKDVQDLIKRCKLWFERDYGISIYNLRYIISPEYGERSTRRPHYHCILINCPENFANFLREVWKRGYFKHFKNGNTNKYFGYGDRVSLQKVWLHHKRYSGNGFKNVASYLSKYTCKGFMDNPAAINGFTCKMRVMTSKNFGSQPTLVELHHWLALDKFKYDPEDVSRLPKKKLQDIVQTIVDRLKFTFPTDVDQQQFPYRIPTVIRQRLFGARLCKSRQDLPKWLQRRIPIGETFPPSGKMVYNGIYYAVQDFIRSRTLQTLQKQFAEFVANSHSENLSQAVASFESYKQSLLKSREEAHKQNLLKYLKHATI